MDRSIRKLPDRTSLRGLQRAVADVQGFSLLEILFATVIFSLVAAVTLQFTSATKIRADKGATLVDVEQQARTAINLLLDDVRHAGYYAYINDGSDIANTRQHSIIEASNYRLAFYSDVNTSIHSPLESMADDTWRTDASTWKDFPNLYTVRFPIIDGHASVTTASGSEYYDHVQTLGGMDNVPDYLKRNAEVILYTLDNDETGNAGNGTITAADKNQLDAALTDNPRDAVVRRKVIGTWRDPADSTWKAFTQNSVVARGVRAYFDTSAYDLGGDKYPNGTIPPPLFVYHISDRYANFDLDGDGDRNNTWVFGDCDDITDTARCGDGVLDPNEAAALHALNGLAPMDIFSGNNYQLDKRLIQGGTTVIDRILLAYPSMSGSDDARQFLRDCIASIKVNLIVEEPTARPNSVDARYSAPGQPYRYIQHDLSAEVYLPNAFMLSKNQLYFASQILQYEDGNDGDPNDTTKMWDPNTCTWDVTKADGSTIADDIGCWPCVGNCAQDGCGC